MLSPTEYVVAAAILAWSLSGIIAHVQVLNREHLWDNDGAYVMFFMAALAGPVTFAIVKRAK